MEGASLLALLDRLPLRDRARRAARMTGPRIGELFAGYGGLGMGVQAALGGDVVWYSDVCKFDRHGNASHYVPHRGPCRVLAHRLPGVPNLGDVTKVDWSTVEPVDVLTGGSPCQDLSHAGRRAGMTEGTRSNLWVAMREAIAQLRPGLVVWENVRGAYSAAADSALEHCPGCMGSPEHSRAPLRALGRVLGDLSDLGYVGAWHGLRAADVGAPHGRFRVFVVAADAQGERRPGGYVPRTQLVDHRPQPAHPGEVGRTLLPTPRAGDGEKGGPNQRGSSGDLMLPSAVVSMLLPTPTTEPTTGNGHARNLGAEVKALLPTPAVNDMGEGKTPEAWDAWTEAMRAKHGNGNGHGASLAIEAQRLLPAPRAEERMQHNSADAYNALSLEVTQERWGQYAEAIARWEDLTRPAPPPTEMGPKGNPRLSARFSEWLMGLPAGWITDVPGITRNEALKLAGNGVVPQQAEAAVRFLLGVLGEVAA